jgi:hypothetical protein
VASVYLSTQTNRFVQSEAVPALGEEGVHEIFGEIFGEHGELCNVEIRVGGPFEVILREPAEIALADRLLRRRRSEGTSEHTEYASVRTPTAAPSSSKIFVFMAMRSKQAFTHS